MSHPFLRSLRRSMPVFAAAAFVVAAITFAQPALSATPDERATVRSDTDTWDGTLFHPVFQDDDGSWVGRGGTGQSSRDRLAERFPTRSAAAASTGLWELKASGADTYTIESFDDGGCLGGLRRAPGISLAEGGCTSMYTRAWSIESGTLVAADGPYRGQSIASALTAASGLTLGTDGPDAVFPELREAAISVSVDEVDVVGGTATLSGSAPAGAEVRIGDERARPGDDGRWTASVADLPFGRSAVSVELWEGGTRTAERRVLVDLPVQALRPGYQWGATRDDEAKIVGRSEIGARIVIERADGEPVADFTATAATFAVPVEAPNAGGPVSFTIEQFVGGRKTETATATIPYGEAVSVTSAVLDDASGHLTVHGRGEAGSVVDVVWDGTFLGKAPVGDDSTWEYSTIVR